MSDYKIIERQLSSVFDTSESGVEYYGRTRPRNLHTFAIVCSKINSKIQLHWSKRFPNASSYSVSKGVSGNHIVLIAEISNDDYNKIVSEFNA